jgi:hypothetical protein
MFKLDHPLTGFVLLAMVALFGTVMFLEVIPMINAWEKAAGYPYGMICEVYHNCK